ncbi:phenylalanine--tRNA ligase subunit beta [Pelagibaculum spongiae]|uniref:Phenylalanine--tRNA ligase beta subunit n=1 Tax=Pelagibaculum spongiae TaxID=2080658 RepID=A0A2V1GWX0_9GAMM|nr:phenylalanine--tRNA ligase subunit beta [Pelagibaculum spongiae]PVZ71594.1 phenylalanine--tRNA ligase subunit beta [Pelagibaculum spongiae]
MKLSEKWLRQLVNPEVDTDQLISQLTMAGLEVDAVEPAAADFSGVVVAEIISAEPHPEADKLQICQVNAGDETVQIVCGAPNARAGLKAPLAKIGAVLPGDFKIKKAKLRKVESFGMLCGADELGLSDDRDGLFELSADAPVGADLRGYLELDDQCIEVDLTPNRGDCLSVAGIAREVGVLNRAPVEYQDIEEISPEIDDQLSIELLAPEACPRYCGRIIKGIKIDATTPVWMQERLRRSGVRSISVVVDVTNYVMLELGQPMHGFDLAQIEGGIRVRMPKVGEKLTLLDGKELELKQNTLIIADHAKPLALGGIMGGEHSGVADTTQDIFLESAFFAPIAIAGKARGYGLHTDASHRYERGVDFELPKLAIERATQLIIEIAGGQPGPVTEAVAEAHLPTRESVKFRAARCCQLLGAEIPVDEMEEILERLGMYVDYQGEDVWQVTPPGYRFDIAIEADLIEEVGRIYGYDRLPVCSLKGDMTLQLNLEKQVPLRAIRRRMVGLGYQEAVTYSFVSPEIQSKMDPELEPVALANPISADMAVMRTTLMAGLVQAMQHNLNRQQSRVRLFETGLSFRKEQNGELMQRPMLAGIICGPRKPMGWSNDKSLVDFFDMKGDLQALLEMSGHAEDFTFATASHPALHPGQTARIMLDDQPVGWLGAIHPRLASELDLPLGVFVFEIELEALQNGRVPGFTPVSKFPEIRRDLALIVPDTLPAQSIINCVQKNAGSLLKEVRMFDIYQGQGVAEGSLSIAITLVIQHQDRTLEDDEVNQLVDTVIGKLTEDCKASLRD